jgi:two-component system, OmpR family, sensor histidine kinase TctE
LDIASMSLKLDPTTSIHRRLLLLLLPPLTLLMLVGGFADYRASMLFMRRAYDQSLADAAFAQAALIKVTDGRLYAQLPSQRESAARGTRAERFLYSVWGPDHLLIVGNPQLPAAAAGDGNPSYVDAWLGHDRIRVVTYRMPTAAGVATINVGETTNRRDVARHFIITSTWLMDFILIDATLLMVLIGVHYGLRPLVAVRGQIEARSPRELKPLETGAVPTEVRPLVDALNGLFEVLREAARAQRQFVADAAHQLRTPIAGLLGQLELLTQDPAARGLESHLATLRDGVSRVAHSANQLLALARAEPSANLADRFENIELPVLIARVIERNVDRALKARLDLGADVSSATVTGSAWLIEDLLGNLVDNALNYTPAGGHVTVRSGGGATDPYLEVEDDGPGIPEAERGRVRQRFYRLPGSQGHGCGLGLAIAEEISRLHRADVTIDSGAGGRGTRIKVQFPAAVAAMHEETANTVTS